jgi:hypothetical protein
MLAPWHVLVPFYYLPPLPQRPLPPPANQPPQAFGLLPSREATYWYCFDTKTYYPEVTTCPGGWQQVVPRAAPPAPPVEMTEQGGVRLRDTNELRPP